MAPYSFVNMLVVRAVDAAYGAFLCDLKKFKRAEIVLTANLRILKNLKFPDGGFAYEGLCVLELQRRNFRAALDYAQQFEEVAKKKRHHENAAKAALRQQEARDGTKAQKRASSCVDASFFFYSPRHTGAYISLLKSHPIELRAAPRRGGQEEAAPRERGEGSFEAARGP